jgi:hypothetical protein
MLAVGLPMGASSTVRNRGENPLHNATASRHSDLGNLHKKFSYGGQVLVDEAHAVEIFLPRTHARERITHACVLAYKELRLMCLGR